MSPRALGFVGFAAWVCCCIWAETASAQGPGCAAYSNGTKAIAAGQWAQAVVELKKAELIDPTPTNAKPCEGNLTNPYYPQYYLAVAYVQLKDYQNAANSLNQARKFKQGFPSKDSKEIDRLRGEIDVGLNPRPNEFDATLARAEQSLRPGSCADSVKDFNNAKGLSQYWFNKENKGGRLSVAEKCAQADQLYADAKSLFDRGQLGQAQQRASAAVAAYPDAAPATTLLREIQARNRTYDEQKRTAEQNAAAGRLEDAKKAYEGARTQNAERFASEGLSARITPIDTDIDARNRGRAAADAERARRERVSTALASAREAYGGGKYGDVGARLKPVFDEDPSNTEARTLMASADSRLLLADGRALVDKRKYKDAEAKFQAALTVDSSNADASAALETSRQFSELVQRGRQLAAKRNPQAREILLQAKSLDSSRFTREGLGPILASVPQPVAPTPAPPPPTPVSTTASTSVLTPAAGGTTALSAGRVPPTDVTLKTALQRLFTGQVSVAINHFQTVVSTSPITDRQTLAIAHAYLGVAHATLALANDDDAAPARRQQAIAEFREALKLKPGIALSAKLVSPRIRYIFDQARSQ